LKSLKAASFGSAFPAHPAAKDHFSIADFAKAQKFMSSPQKLEY
jgi:hypothetical protein